MKNILYMIFFCGLITTTKGQTITNNGSTLYISPGTTMMVTGNIYNTSGTLTNAGQITTTGSVTNSSTYNGSGKIELTGNNAQTINLGTSPLYNLDVNKGSSTVILGNDLTISGTIDLTGSDNYIILGGNNLTLQNGATITGNSSSGFIVTNNTGKLIYNNLGSSAITFPIGSANSSSNYTPITLSNTGTADDIGVSVADNAYNTYVNGVGSGSVLNNGEVQKTWIVNEAVAGGSNINIALQWNAANEGSSFSRSWAAIGYYNNGAWQPNTNFASSTGSGPYTLSRSGVQGINLDNTPFGLGGQLSPLPLHLLNFTAEKQGTNAILKWAAANENELSHYEMERSIDGKTWRKIGNDITPLYKSYNEYEYIDKNLNEIVSSGNIYYRIKGVDLDEDVDYSLVRVVNLNNTQTTAPISIYPNPANEIVYISSSNKISFGLYNTGGKLISNSQSNLLLHSIDVSTLSAGMYMLQITDENGIVQNQKVMVGR